LRLDFNVLWVDDQPDRIDAQIKRIAKQMEDEGFQFNPTSCRSINEAREKVGASVFADEIDLILVDWDLGGGQQGQDAIAAIRENIPYKDVVFYSAQNPADALRKLANDKGVEGIYCASREDLVDEVLGVFESLVKKVLDLDHTRGIVIGATSDIDFMVNECLVAIHAQSDEDGKQALLVQAREFIEAKIKKLTELAEKMRAATDFPELFEAHLVFTAYDRLRVLARALDSQALQAHKGYRESVTSYQQDVVPKRNVLGHAARVLQGEAYVLVDSKGRVYTLESTRDLRKLILGLRADFRSLLDALQAAGAGTVASEPARGK
jgi:CheY-like chemotaxis protein